jgi:uncharacterized membrane protein YoaK (UPF0700 family)
VARHGVEPLTPFPGSLALVAGLAAVAGCLDALSLFRLTGTFVAFQSGNTVLMGLRIGQGDWAHVWPLLVAVLTYVLGSALTPFVIRAGNGVAGARRRLLVCATGLLATDALIVLAVFGAGSETPTGTMRYVGIVMATLAMATQTPVVRQVGGVTVSSTFSSGMLVRFGQGLGELVHRDARARELPVVRILGITNLAFLGGAIVGGVAIEAWGNIAILVPTVTLAAIAVVDDRSGRAR